MITIPHSTTLVMRQMKMFPYMFVKAAKAAALGTDYSLAYKEGDDAQLVLISKAKFDAQVAAVDPGSSLAPLYKSLSFDMTSASVRADEVYHLVLGLSNFPGNADDPHELALTGFEHKILVEGTSLTNRVENKVSASGAVVADYPIASLDSVSARKSGADLVVSAVPSLSLGVVDLTDGGPAIADGVAVELRYQTKNNLVILVKDGKENVVSVILSKEFNDFLLANA